jgi:hypothetical protein
MFDRVLDKLHIGKPRNRPVNKLLDDNGWVDGVLQQAKKLDDPFLSDDPDLLEAYEAAKGTGCIIVYRDPIS